VTCYLFSILTASLDPKKKELDDEVYSASKVVKELKRVIKKDKENGDDTSANERKLPGAEKRHADAKKALDDYTAKVDPHNVQKASTSDTIIATPGSSQSTAVESKTTEGKSSKKRWNLRSQAPQARQTQPVR
jgi:hypothetical protein